MSLYFLSVSKYLLTMRNMSLNTKKYKLPSNIDVPTTTPYPYKCVKRNVAGWNHNRASLFRRIPDQSAHSKALLSVPETRVEEKIVTIFKFLLKKFLVRAHTYIFKLIKEAQHTISSHVANNWKYRWHHESWLTIW